MKPGTKIALLGLFGLILAGCQRPGPVPPSSDFVQFYENSSSSPLLDSIRAAQKTIDIEIYEMADSYVLGALEDALSRGVHIRVVKDNSTVGMACAVLTEPTPDDSAECVHQKELRKKIQSSGGSYVAFDKQVLCGQPGASCFEHGKLAIFDRKRALISSGNYDSSNLCTSKNKSDRCNRDYSVATTDPETIQGLLAIYESDLKAQVPAWDSILTPSLEAKLTVSPHSRKPLLALLRSAKKKIRVQNQYIKDEELKDVLIEMASSGVDVSVNTASFCAFGSAPKPGSNARLLVERFYGAFDLVRLAGMETPNPVRTSLFTSKVLVAGHPGYLHAKAIVVDEESSTAKAWVGSVNGSASGMDNNREYGLFTSAQSIVRALARIIDEDFHSPGAETWRESLDCVRERESARP